MAIRIYRHIRLPFRRILLLIPLLMIFLVMYRLLIPRMNAFGCFDDCSNYVGGYFIRRGLRIYTDFFFNHQPLMAFLSAAVQYFVPQDSIPLLLLRHRQTLVLFGLLASTVIILRFGFTGILFSAVYELTKFYYFGDRFLAEGFIVYPLVYLLLLVLKNRHIGYADAAVVVVGTWFTVVMREPYIPVAICLFFLCIRLLSTKRARIVAATALVAGCLVPFVYISAPDYFFNVITVNRQSVLAAEITGNNLLGTGILKSFFYPLLVFTAPSEWNPLRIYLGILNLLLFTGIGIRLRNPSSRISVFIIFTVLGLANIRFAPPGLAYYGAFHMLPWYALFLASTAYLLWETEATRGKTRILALLLPFVTIIFISLPSSYLREHIIPHEEFLTQFGQYVGTGKAIRSLTSPGATLFLDGGDDLIYFQSGLMSPYRYGWYTSVMPQFSRYSKARSDMFENTPPDIYYRFCSEKPQAGYMLPKSIRDSYTVLYTNGHPSCVFVRNTYLSTITDTQWARAAALQFTPPPRISTESSTSP